ncbi:MAG: helix-turn-helix domain-containing protein [Xenococcaceae cyanobacterium]
MKEQIESKITLNPGQYPAREVMNKICSTYGIQPGDLLEWVPNENKESTAA